MLDLFIWLLLYLSCFFLKGKNVNKSKKRKRGQKIDVDAGSKPNEKIRFNTTTRCSLKELALCLKLLQPRHLKELNIGGLGHLKDFSIKDNINRRLICFLMFMVDPITMTLDLRDGTKKLQITADSIELLFGLPRGNKTPMRPAESGYLDDLMDLKAELGIPRNQQIETKHLRKILAKLVVDKANDKLAMKVFGLILYNKFICPGYSVRVSREAQMVKDFDASKLKDIDLCQLLVDELRKAVFAWQGANADWKAIPGCGISLLLMYLDCLDHKLSPKDMRVPRILHFNPSILRQLADLDCIVEGNEFPETWIYGKLPVSFIFSFTILYTVFSFSYR